MQFNWAQFLSVAYPKLFDYVDSQGILINRYIYNKINYYQIEGLTYCIYKFDSGSILQKVYLHGVNLKFLKIEVFRVLVSRFRRITFYSCLWNVVHIHVYARIREFLLTRTDWDWHSVGEGGRIWRWLSCMEQYGRWVFTDWVHVKDCY